MKAIMFKLRDGLEEHINNFNEKEKDEKNIFIIIYNIFSNGVY